jgi:hypothetical protein
MLRMQHTSAERMRRLCLDHGNLLICDNKNELHGNLGPLAGEGKNPRYSIVAFLHEHVLDYANRTGQWAPKTSTKTPATTQTSASGA